MIQKLTYTNGNQVIPVEYFYDANNRLIREVNTGNVTNYAYDNYGNITSRGGKTVDYDDKNRIISYDGKTFKYASNNPYKLLSYGTYNGTTQLTGLSFTYLGRNISSITDHNINTTYSFTYDHQGRRITKQVNNDSVIQYVYLNNRLEAEIRSSYTLRFLYDEHNNLYGFYYNDIPYFYLRNALGTIYGIIDQTGKKVVEYTYDAWGKLLTTTRSNDTNNIASINPFIYKAYYYDVETGLAMVGQRYYSPELGRFIQPADVSSLNPSSINGLNLYSYANNNPIGIAYSSFGATFGTSGGMIGSTRGTIGNIVGSGSEGGESKISGFGSLGGSSFSSINWPKANSVAMTHYTTSLIKNPFISWMLGNISYTKTVQLNSAETFYSFSNVGNDGYSAGVGFNFGNWYGGSVYVSSDIGFGSSWQLTPWLTGSSGWSLENGI